MPNRRVFIVAVILFVAVFFSVSHRVSLRALGIAPSEFKPYVMEQTNYKVTPEGESILARQTESRRRDGAKHIIITGYQGTNQEPSLRKVEFPSGLAVMVSDAVHGKSTGRLKKVADSFNSNVINHPANCVWNNEVGDGQEMLLGQLAYRVVMQGDRPDSLMRFIYWRFPDYDCVTAQVSVQRRVSVSEPWQTGYGLRLISFKGADPDDTIFKDWETYEEMKPSDVKRRLSLKKGLTSESCPKCFEDEPADLTYEMYRP